MTDFDLFPGAKIATSFGSEDHEAVLGIVARDVTDGAYYGVTARDLFLSNQAVSIRTGGKQKKVGTPHNLARQSAEGTPLDAMDMVGFLKVSSDVTISDRSPLLGLPIAETVAVTSVVAEHLLALGSKGEIPLSLVSYGVEFEYEDADNGSHVVTNGIEVAAVEGHTGFEEGDAGAPVITRKGQLVGVVIAVDGESAMVAGLHEPFKALGLEVYLAEMRYRLRSDGGDGTKRNEGSVRIAGVTLPQQKRVVIALTSIYGIGPKTASDICNVVGIASACRVHQLTAAEVNSIRQYIEDQLLVEGDLRREVAQNIKRLMDLNCYRGLRHRRGLPVRGQRTHTNARTRKGPAKAIAGKKK